MTFMSTLSISQKLCTILRLALSDWQNYDLKKKFFFQYQIFGAKYQFEKTKLPQ